MSKNRNSSLSVVVVVFCILAMCAGFVYYKGITRKPLVYSVIPDGTLDWIESLKEWFPKSTKIKYVDVGPFEWDNKEDYGNRKENGWKSISDNNFVVYYRPDPDSLWKDNALKTLFEADKSIPHIERSMGRYAYPSDVNERKLSIYIADSDNCFDSAVNDMSETTGSYQGCLGMYISQIGPLGSLAKGIVLSPRCFDTGVIRENSLRVVLRHEMAHYVFFTMLDYGKVVRPSQWVTEGMAEYISGRYSSQISGMDTVAFIDRFCHLEGQFPQDTIVAGKSYVNAQYWAGESFFRFLNDSCGGNNTITRFIKNLYTSPVDSSIMRVTSSVLPDTVSAHDKWVETLRNATNIDTKN